MKVGGWVIKGRLYQLITNECDLKENFDIFHDKGKKNIYSNDI